MFNLIEALEAVKNKPEFSVMEKDGYTCIDYNVQTPTTFVGADDRETLILQNLRGTCFGPDGMIVRLPLHKFHNLNECPGYMEHEIDFNQPHYIMEKLDGSMLAAIRIKDYYRLGTRAGITDVSMMAETWLAEQPKEIQDNYDAFISRMIDSNFTPIFEFCSRMNKIVIDHPEPHLTLIAIRANFDGRYSDKQALERCSETYNIPLVKFHDPKLIDINKVREWKDSEGIVIAFEDGKRIKVKAEDYVRKHRAKDLVRFEKDVVKLILEDAVDDVLPLLEEDVRKKLRNYQVRLLDDIELTDMAMITTVKLLKETEKVSTKKEFAEHILNEREYDWKKYSSFYFKVYDGKAPGVSEYLLKNCSSSTKIANALELFGFFRWEG